VSLLLLAGGFDLFHWAIGNGATVAQARTVAVNVFVMGELMYLFNCRSLTKSVFSLGFFSNRLLLAGVAGMIALQLAFTYLEPMNRIFHSAPLGFVEWAAVMAAAVLISAAVAAEKWLQSR
jgi:Ca2+-transporting ATPase